MDLKSFKPSKNMTFETVQADCQRLHDFCHANKETSLHFDLGEVLHCDSAGLALLIEAKRLCSLQTKTCKIISMPKIVHALAKFCGVDEMLELVD